MNPDPPSKSNKTSTWTLGGVLLLVSAIAIFVLLGLAVSTTREASRLAVRFHQSYGVVVELEGLLKSLQRTEANLRQYALDGSPESLQDQELARTELEEHLLISEGLLNSLGAPEDSIHKMNTLVQQRLAAMDSQVAAANQEGVESLRTALSSSGFRMTHQTLAELIRDLQAEQNRALQELDWRAVSRAGTVRLLLWSGGVLNLGLLAAAAVLWHRERRRRELEAQLEKDRQRELERLVDERTADLQEKILDYQWSSTNLLRQLRHTEHILQAIREPLVIVSQEGNLIRMNAAAIEISGWSATEIAGKPLRSLLLPEETGSPKKWQEDPLRQRMKLGQEHSETGMLCRKDGSWLSVHWRAYPVRDEDHVVGAVVVCHV